MYSAGRVDACGSNARCQEIMGMYEALCTEAEFASADECSPEHSKFSADSEFGIAFLKLLEEGGVTGEPDEIIKEVKKLVKKTAEKVDKPDDADDADEPDDVDDADDADDVDDADDDEDSDDRPAKGKRKKKKAVEKEEDPHRFHWEWKHVGIPRDLVQGIYDLGFMGGVRADTHPGFGGENDLYNEMTTSSGTTHGFRLKLNPVRLGKSKRVALTAEIARRWMMTEAPGDRYDNVRGTAPDPSYIREDLAAAGLRFFFLHSEYVDLSLDVLGGLRWFYGEHLELGGFGADETLSLDRVPTFLGGLTADCGPIAFSARVEGTSDRVTTKTFTGLTDADPSTYRYGVDPWKVYLSVGANITDLARRIFNPDDDEGAAEEADE